MKNKKVFLVTSGSYSDYGVDAVFSTKELAEAFIGSFGYDKFSEMEVEEWDLDKNEQHLKGGRKAYFLRIDRDGVVIDLENTSSTYGFKHVEHGLSYTHDKKHLNLYVFADNEEHAVKIAGEKRTRILAGNAWGDTSYLSAI